MRHAFEQEQMTYFANFLYSLAAPLARPERRRLERLAGKFAGNRSSVHLKVLEKATVIQYAQLGINILDQKWQEETDEDKKKHIEKAQETLNAVVEKLIPKPKVVEEVQDRLFTAEGDTIHEAETDTRELEPAVSGESAG